MPQVEVPRHRHSESLRNHVPAGAAGAGVVGTLEFGFQVVLDCGTVVVARTVVVVLELVVLERTVEVVVDPTTLVVGVAVDATVVETTVEG